MTLDAYAPPPQRQPEQQHDEGKDQHRYNNFSEDEYDGRVGLRRRAFDRLFENVAWLVDLWRACRMVREPEREEPEDRREQEGQHGGDDIDQPVIDSPYPGQCLLRLRQEGRAGEAVDEDGNEQQADADDGDDGNDSSLLRRRVAFQSGWMRMTHKGDASQSVRRQREEQEERDKQQQRHRVAEVRGDTGACYSSLQQNDASDEQHARLQRLEYTGWLQFALRQPDAAPAEENGNCHNGDDVIRLPIEQQDVIYHR